MACIIWDVGCVIKDNMPRCRYNIGGNLFTHIIYWTTSPIMCVIGYRIITTHGTIQMNRSAENKVDTTNIGLTRNSAALVDTEGTGTTRDGIKLLTFNYTGK